MTVREIADPETGQTLLIDPDIPGQIGMDALIAMAKLAKRVPQNGVVVETGSLYGRSSFVWAKNVHPSVTVHCIDPWERAQWVIDIVEKPQKVALPFSLDAFRHFTRDCPNIKPIRGYSPDVVKDTWQGDVDLYFDDSDHDEPGLSRNRDFWTARIKPGGLFVADEYDAMFPACLRKTHQIASEWGMPVDHVGLICWVQKPLGKPAPWPARGAPPANKKGWLRRMLSGENAAAQ